MIAENSQPPRGNKGEWSEFYAFVKILSDGKVYAADKDLHILKDHFHTVLKIVRNEARGLKSYVISKNGDQVIILDGETELGVVELSKIKNSVARIFEEIKNSSGTTFEIESASESMNDLQCTQLKASSGKKTDLTIVLHDERSPELPELGFSIKSMLGAPSTLLNASGATNFVYRIASKNNDSISSNQNLKVREVAKLAYNGGARFEYIGMDNETFRRNLRKIDSIFPVIISEMLKLYYSGSATTIKELTDRLSEDSDFMNRIDFTKDMLIINIKNFLSNIALGMMPSKDWDGRTEAHGGYIIVKEDGDVVCYHLYNRDKFEEYLFHNTKLDTPSTSRHGFGNIYMEEGEQRIRYNLQIRFLK